MDRVLDRRKTWDGLSALRDLKNSGVKKYAVVAIIINVVLMIVLLVLLSKQSSLKSEKRAELICQSEPEVRTVDDLRMYCFRLDEKDCLDRGYTVKLKRNFSVCCANMDTHVYSVMSQELSEKLETDAAKDKVVRRIKDYITRLQRDESVVDVRPAAHVGINPNGTFTGPDSDAPRIHWETGSDRSIVSGGLVHGGDRMRVTKAGYYFVYTGLQFNVDPEQVESGAIVAYIYRHVNGTRASRRKLMMARESSCKQTRDVHGPVSVYMAGIFLLREQDEISVRTHSQSLLNRSPATTYFGMHVV